MTSTTVYNSDKSLLFYSQVHQPRRLKKFRFFDIGSHADYFDDRLNERILTRVSRECYLPANKILLELISQYPSVRICFSIPGVTLDQFERYAPEAIDSFKALADTGAMEFFSETDYHSLPSLISEEEFQTQIFQHAEKILHHFGLRTTVFRKTDLIYNDTIGSMISRLGFNGVVCESVDRIIDPKSTVAVYNHPEETNLKILLRNIRLSDDIMFRYGDRKSRLTVEEYLKRLYNAPESNKVILLGLN